MAFFSEWTKRFTSIAVSLLLLIGVIALAAQPAAAETYEVLMGTNRGQLAFEPKELEISAGDTVVWVNNKVYPHNVIFDKVPGGDGALAAKLSHKKLAMRPKETFDATFADVPAGEYSYYCTPHRGAGMVGKIIVKG